MVSTIRRSLYLNVLLFIFFQDIADLFGADLPVDGGKGGQFSWRDGLFLQALKSGHWIVLDEVKLQKKSIPLIWDTLTSCINVVLYALKFVPNNHNSVSLG